MRLEDVKWYDGGVRQWRYAMNVYDMHGLLKISHEIEKGFYRLNPCEAGELDMSPLEFTCWLLDKSAGKCRRP